MENAIAQDHQHVDIWSMSDCSRCERVLAALRAQNQRIIVRDLEKLVRGEEENLDALAHWAYSGGVAPVVFLDGRFLEVEEVAALIRPEKNKAILDKEAG